MKIKSNLRAGSGGSTGGGTGGGGASGSGQNSKSVDVVPVIYNGINPASRCAGI